MTAAPAIASSASALEVHGLNVDVRVKGTWQRAVSDVSFSVLPGETLGIVGESGSGKSLTARAIAGLLPPGARSSGEVLVAGREVLGPRGETRVDRHQDLAMVFQNPMSSLNPAMTVGAQIAEAVRASDPTISKRAALDGAVELLRLVDITDPEYSARRYPFEFSGGMQQRAMIALAVGKGPKVLLADEPTTALDVTVQREVMNLLDRLREQLGLSIVLISHNLALVSERCDHLLVMYAGDVVEAGASRDVLEHPSHPYLAALIEADPGHVDEGALPRPILGRVPGPGEADPETCRFAPRCEYRMPSCTEAHPDLRAVASEHVVRCIRQPVAPLHGAPALGSSRPVHMNINSEEDRW